jgi:TATA-box binding protein (TBP) (component of TFIID and TFIIIB)
VDLDKLYIYIEGARPPCLSARYRSSRGRGQIPALLIYCETPSYRVTIELFRTGRFQAKGASKLSDLEEVVEKMISVIEASGSYFEC